MRQFKTPQILEPKHIVLHYQQLLMAAKVENNIVFYFPNIYMIGMIMEIPKQNNIKKKENRIKKS